MHQVGKNDYHYIRMHSQQNIEISSVMWYQPTIPVKMEYMLNTQCFGLLK